MKKLCLVLGVVLLAACSRATLSNPQSVSEPYVSTTRNRLAVLSSAPQSSLVGYVDVINLVEKTVARADQPVHSDARMREFAESPYLYVVNRQGQDNIQVFDKATLKSALPQVSVSQFNEVVTSEGKTQELPANLQDLISVSDRRVWVTRYNAKTLIQMDLATGKRELSIDLVSLKDAEQKDADVSATEPILDCDGLPEMCRMQRFEGGLFIQLQRLDGGVFREKKSWATTGFSSIAVVAEGGGAVSGRRLELKNPVTEFVAGEPGEVLVGMAGSWGKEDGGVERLDSRTGKSLGVLLTEKELGGDIFEIAYSKGRVWALIYEFKGGTSLVEWQHDGGVKRLLSVKGTDYLTSLLYDSERELLFTGEAAKQPRVRVWDLVKNEERSALLVPLAPAQLLLMEGK